MSDTSGDRGDEDPVVSAKRRELVRVNGMRDASASLLSNLQAADAALEKIVPAMETAAFIVERWGSLMDCASIPAVPNES
jgi:hypothetical protein